MNIRLYLYRKRERLKKSLFHALQSSCKVLLYHRVINEEYDPQQLCVSPENFNEQLTRLKEKGIFLTIEEFCHILSTGRKFPRNAMMITFDDGYADNYSNALPILESLGLQAVFYIATNNLNTNNLFWWDTLDLVYKNMEVNKHELLTLARENNLNDPDQLYDFYLKQCKTASSLETREKLMNRLTSSTTIDQEMSKRYRCLSDDMLKKMVASKSVVIGGHTVNHLSLAHQERKDQYFEIKNSVDYLTSATGHNIEHFSFPYGEHIHFNNETLAICRELNLKSGAANYYDHVKSSDDVMAFPRIVVRNDNFYTLYRKLKRMPA
jgi:peptidoglycan/xylan/chitin deacetylase (PgdA/CDA1 family)